MSYYNETDGVVSNNTIVDNVLDIVLSPKSKSAALIEKEYNVLLALNGYNTHTVLSVDGNKSLLDNVLHSSGQDLIFDIVGKILVYLAIEIGREELNILCTDVCNSIGGMLIDSGTKFNSDNTNATPIKNTMVMGIIVILITRSRKYIQLLEEHLDKISKSTG